MKNVINPLKNKTNLKTSVFTSKEENLNENEIKLLKKHKKAEKNEIIAMAKYLKNTDKFYKENDKILFSIENEILFEKRSLLIDWIIGIHKNLNLTDDTFYFAVFIIDKFLSKMKISKKKYEIVGLSSLIIASKVEEVTCPCINTFISATNNIYNINEILKAEKYILYILNYNIKFINPLYFLRRASKANSYEVKTRTMGKYFLDLMILNINFNKYSKNIISTVAIYLSRKILNKDENKNLFFSYTTVNRDQIKECFMKLVNLIYEDENFENLEKKYKSEQYFNVSQISREYAQKYFK